MINLREKWHHLGVQHGSEQVGMQGWVSESRGEAATLTISSLGMNFARGNFARGWDPPAEFAGELPKENEFEEHDDEHWW